MYVVTAPALIQSIQKQHKLLSFAPVVAQFTHRAAGSSQEGHDILMRNVDGLYMEISAALRAALAPGPSLDEMNRVMIQNVAASIDDLGTTGRPVKKRLAQWLRNTVTIATTNSIYGPQNPYKDQSVQDAFW